MQLSFQVISGMKYWVEDLFEVRTGEACQESLGDPCRWFLRSPHLRPPESQDCSRTYSSRLDAAPEANPFDLRDCVGIQCWQYMLLNSVRFGSYQAAQATQLLASFSQDFRPKTSAYQATTFRQGGSLILLPASRICNSL